MYSKKRRWARLDSENKVVEFTRIDPLGRFHPDIVWIEVDEDTKWGTKLTLFGNEIKYNPNEVIGKPVDLHEVWLRIEKEKKEEEELLNSKPKDPTVSDYTIDLDPELKAGK